MLRSGIAFDVWLRQPDGVIETAIRKYNEQAEIDAGHDPGSGWSG
jgi:hypothetical protein